MKESKCKMVNFENTKIKGKKKDSKCLQRKKFALYVMRNTKWGKISNSEGN